MGLCLRYVKNETDAVEVLNSGYLKAFRHIDTYDVLKGSFYTWLSTIILNTCLSFIKSRKGKGIELVLLNEEYDMPVGPEILSNYNSQDILDLIRQLPHMPQAVFNLFIIEGFSHKEIGQKLGISEGTSKWYLSEARKQLQTMFKEIVNE